MAGRQTDAARSGFTDVVAAVYRGVGENRILANAAAVTFYALLSVFPGIAALVSIYALFADPRSIAHHLDAMVGLFPGGAIVVIRDQLDRIAAQGPTRLGLSFAISLAVSMWSANGGMKAMFDALNAVFEERERRGFVKLNAVSLLFTAGLVGFVIVALGGIVALPVALRWVPRLVTPSLAYLRWPVLLVLVALALALLFRFGPSRTRPRWHWVTWGTGFAAIGWMAASAVFSWYAASFGTFNKTYGSLGAVVGFMMWMWLSAIVVLVGAKLDAVIQRPTTLR